MGDCCANKNKWQNDTRICSSKGFYQEIKRKWSPQQEARKANHWNFQTTIVLLFLLLKITENKIVSFAGKKKKRMELENIVSKEISQLKTNMSCFLSNVGSRLFLKM